MFKKVLEYFSKSWYDLIIRIGKENGCDNMIRYDIRDIARWLLKKEPMTHKRLQKYLYFFYGEYLVIKNLDFEHISTELFANDFEGWAHGPVSPIIYQIYKGSGYRCLQLHPSAKVDVCSQDEIILNGIYDKYKKYTTDELEDMSHKQNPWKKSREGLDCFDIGNRPIKTIDIFECFKNGSNN